MYFQRTKKNLAFNVKQINCPLLTLWTYLDFFFGKILFYFFNLQMSLTKLMIIFTLGIRMVDTFSSWAFLHISKFTTFGSILPQSELSLVWAGGLVLLIMLTATGTVTHSKWEVHRAVDGFCKKARLYIEKDLCEPCNEAQDTKRNMSIKILFWSS